MIKNSIRAYCSEMSAFDFGRLIINPTSESKSILPSMPSDEVQKNWCGNSGEGLLRETVAFIETFIQIYEKITNRTINSSKILDYGCGWGRHMRLMLKYAEPDNLYGVDSWDESISLCKKHNVLGHLSLCDKVPRSLPFETKFDLIYSFSVFTHLSEKTTHAVLNVIRGNINPNGILFVTIRPKEYWNYHRSAWGHITKKSEGMEDIHEEKGFAFLPHNIPPIDGDVVYGDSSISLEYIENNFTGWSLVDSVINEIDPYQQIVVLRPS